MVDRNDSERRNDFMNGSSSVKKTKTENTTMIGDLHRFPGPQGTYQFPL